MLVEVVVAVGSGEREGRTGTDAVPLPDRRPKGSLLSVVMMLVEVVVAVVVVVVAVAVVVAVDDMVVGLVKSCITKSGKSN